MGKSNERKIDWTAFAKGIEDVFTLIPKESDYEDILKDIENPRKTMNNVREQISNIIKSSWKRIRDSEEKRTGETRRDLGIS